MFIFQTTYIYTENWIFKPSKTQILKFPKNKQSNNQIIEIEAHTSKQENIYWWRLSDNNDLPMISTAQQTEKKTEIINQGIEMKEE